MRNLKVRTRLEALLLSGFILVGSYVGIAKAKDTSDYELKSTPVGNVLEDEKICNLTTLDEEIAAGNVDIIEKDEEFRKQIMYLGYYESAGETEEYNKTLNWLRDNIQTTAKSVLLDAVKGAIAEDENVEISDIKLTPAPDYNEDTLFFRPKGVAEIKVDYDSIGYKIESEALNDAINLYALIQDTDFSETSEKEIVKLYDKVANTSKMAIAAGANRHDDEIGEKNSKKYIKKNYDI